MHIVVLLVIVVAAVVWFARARELFVLRVRAGEVTVVRGQIPPGLLADFAAALKDVHSATITVFRGSDGAELTTRGDVGPGREQRLRNMLNLRGMSRLSAPDIDKRRAASDLFTLHWLVSLFRRR